jgi:K+-transporting ATPase ATPase C chain
MRALFKQIRPTLIFLAALTLLFGVAYPGVSSLILQAGFPNEAQGSLIVGKKGEILGSALIGQNFSDPRYFWGRISATTPFPYNAASSTGSNLGANNPALLDAVKARITALKKADPDNKRLIPVDLVTASGSGLDPHISLAAAEYQIARVAHLRGKSESEIHALVDRFTQNRQFGLLGEPYVHVLELNLALDGKL